MTDPTSLAYLAPLGRMLGTIGPVLPRLLEVYRNGGGISWDDLGDDARQSQADANRPWYEKQLGPTLAGVPAIHDALAAPGCPGPRRGLRRRLVEHRLGSSVPLGNGARRRYRPALG